MAGAPPVSPKVQFTSSTGAPLANGTVTVYLAGTTTLTDTWQDKDLTTLNTNPITLDSRGEALMWLDDTLTYKFLLKNAAGVTQWTVDNISGAAPANSNGISFLQAGAGAVARTAQAKMRESVSAFDFMTAAQIADVQARTLTLDVTATIAAAVLAHPNKDIFCPSGTYKLTSGVTLAAGQRIIGQGQENTIFSCSDAFDAFTLSSSYSGVSDCSLTSVSARTANAYVKLSAATRGNFVRRVKMTNAYIGVWIAAEAVINYLEDLELMDTAPGTGVGIWINGGNDTFLTRVVMDAPVGSQPLCGIRIQRSQATWATDCDMIHQGRGIQIDPNGASSGLITWCFFANVACDLGSGDGLYVNPNNTTVKGLFFNNCWFSSNSLNGVNLLETGTGAVDAVFFHGCTMFNNVQRGAYNQLASNVEWNNCRVAGNSSSVSGTFAGIEIANNTSNFAVRGTRSGAIAGFSPTQSYGLLIGTGCNAYIVTDNDLTGNATGAAADGSSGTSTLREVRGNLGYKTTASGAATILAGANSVSVTHGLGGTPSVVVATPSNVNLAGLDFWTGTFAATTFAINVSANVPGNSPFSWTASLYN